MSLLDWLRKLGILRFGAEKAVYRNATERPISMQQPGVLNSEKDVFHFGEKKTEAQRQNDESKESQ